MKNENILSTFNLYENNYSDEILEKDFKNENHIEVNVINIVLFNAQVATDINKDYCV